MPRLRQRRDELEAGKGASRTVCILITFKPPGALETAAYWVKANVPASQGEGGLTPGEMSVGQ